MSSDQTTTSRQSDQTTTPEHPNDALDVTDVADYLGRQYGGWYEIARAYEAATGWPELAAEGKTVFVTTHYMDEAERCHRVALMHAGALIRLDTIPALKGIFAEDSVVEVSCARPALALLELEGMRGVGDAALFGETLHVVLEAPDALDGVRRRLADRGFEPVEARPIVPSLEDVFIRSIGEAERSRAVGDEARGGGSRAEGS